jgi:hypothetical protein
LLAPALFIGRAISVLAEPNFKEQQEHSSAQPSRDEDDGEDLTSYAAHERRAHAPGERQCESRPERQEARARCHRFKVSCEDS